MRQWFMKLTSQEPSAKTAAGLTSLSAVRLISLWRSTMGNAEYTITLTEEELGLVLLALVPNRELQQKIKEQTWKQVKASA